MQYSIHNINRLFFLGTSIALLLIIRFLLVWNTKRKLKKQLRNKNFIESQLKSVNNQVSPQFIQNNFDYLVDQVRNHDNNDYAIKVLRELSVYMRQVVEFSTESVISLENELDYTAMYLQTQCIISNNRFSYSIDVAPAVDTIGVTVPVMLLHPVMEAFFQQQLQSGTSNGHVAVHIDNNSQAVQINLILNSGMEQFNQHELKSIEQSVNNRLASMPAEIKGQCTFRFYDDGSMIWDIKIPLLYNDTEL